MMIKNDDDDAADRNDVDKSDNDENDDDETIPSPSGRCGPCAVCSKRDTKRLNLALHKTHASVAGTGTRIHFNLNFNFFCLRSNEPCEVIAGPLPQNLNTAQNAAMKWQKLKVSSQTVTLQ
jgi:hypothetical protein